MKKFHVIIIVLLIGIALGWGINSLIISSEFGLLEKEEQPLYWVAPMDPNYRRDKPGKSPMGMDLVPVYEESSGSDNTAGTIYISPEVVNNIGVRTASVQREMLHSVVNTVGYVNYDEDRLIHIHPRVEGWIEILNVKAEGDPVSKGQALYQLYSPELVNAQEELLLALGRNNQVLIKAAEARMKALQISEQFVSKLKSSRQVEQNITFYSPQNGVIDNLNIREGFYVKPGTTLMSIGDLSSVWVQAEVFERQAAHVNLGDRVTMSLDYNPGRKWTGEVDYIYPALNEQTRTVKLRLRFENKDRVLKPNMFAQITIESRLDDEVIMVPREAVIRTGRRDRVVLALGDGKFKSLEIKLGRQSEQGYEVLSGLKEGDKVVTSAQFLIDSESSKTSDFKRMSVRESVPEKVWVEATIKQINLDSNIIVAYHQPIPEWDWPSMTMEFMIDESVDITPLNSGLTLHLELKKEVNDSGEKTYRITGTHIMDSQSKSDIQTATVDGTIKHIDPQEKTVTILRGAIEKWGRPSATVDFLISDELQISSFVIGQSIRFTFEIREGKFIVTQLHRLDAEQQ
ncbi:efflux RND transporter periplasmic adaptor subunit [Pleionea sediminis]|uniref:efflux RND transporter periplasmic adaptor subunit n=1 Tax=Pleionea sediminis TaxID=2569479 RepID=UPI0011859DA0|nr:efflux RND transporter periplasmic adaptor subunit [Pleionea sediminis]